MSKRQTQSGIPLKAVYTPDDVSGLDYRRDLGAPGDFPYTRGRRVAGTERGWIQRELSGEGEPSRSNEQFKFLLAKGQTGLDVIGDSPTMSMVDPDHPFAIHTVGTQGVSLCRGQDYVELYEGLPLDRITLSHSLPPAFGTAGLYLAAKAHGVSPAVIRGSMLQAPFYIEDCSYAVHMPFRLRLRMTTDSIEFCTAEMPKFHAFLEDTYYISDGGLDAVEEMALGFIEIRYVARDLIARGLDIDAFAPRIAILLNSHMDFFETLAKVRATRRLYARMMRDEFGAKDPRSLAVNIASHTSGLSMTAQQPANNIVRGAVQSLALALAGVQAIEISTFDEAYRTPSPEAHEVGLRTQQIVQSEARASQVADPLGGSYFVESLTDELERRIETMVNEIEALGDPAELSDNGYFRGVFVRAAERYASQIASGALPKVGVNMHQVPEDEDTLLRDVTDSKIEPCHAHREAIVAFKQDRSKKDVADTLRAVYDTAKAEDGNLMYPIVTATEAGATMGEIAGILRQAYGGAYDPYGAVPPILGEMS